MGECKQDKLPTVQTQAGSAEKKACKQETEAGQVYFNLYNRSFHIRKSTLVRRPNEQLGTETAERTSK